MTILFSYIAKDYFRYWIFNLTALVSIVVVANLFGNIDLVFRNWRAFLGFVDKTLRSLPETVEILLPMTVLLASVFTFNAYSRNSELIAMKSAGMGIARQVLPVYTVLLFITAFGYFNQNYLIRWVRTPSQTSLDTITEAQWRSFNNTILYVGQIHHSELRLSSARVFSWDSQASHLSGYDSFDSGTLQPDQTWLFTKTTQREIQQGRWKLEAQNQLKIPSDQFPNVFRQVDRDLHHTPIFELSRQIGQLENNTRLVALYYVEWYQKLGALLAPFSLVLVGIPLSQYHFRRGRVSAEILLTLLLGLIFMIGTQITFLLGRGGFVPPLWSAGSINLLFFLVGCILLLRTR